MRKTRMPGVFKAITGTVYSAWNGALWLVERIYRILQRKETGVCRGLEKKGENMTE